MVSEGKCFCHVPSWALMGLRRERQEHVSFMYGGVETIDSHEAM